MAPGYLPGVFFLLPPGLFYSHRLTTKNTAISSNTRANTKSVASSANGNRLSSPVFPCLVGACKCATMSQEPGPGIPLILVGGRIGTGPGWQDRFAEPSRLPNVAHRPVLPKVKHI